MIRGFLNLPWFVWAALALLVALIYAFVWPHKVMSESTGLRFLIIRWGHTLTWLLLAINFILRGISPSLNGAANLVAVAGGIVYILFMFMSFVMK
jgi:hypothetical protein